MKPTSALADAVLRAQLACSQWFNENQAQILSALEDGDDDDREAAGELRALLADWHTASAQLLSSISSGATP